MRPPMVRPPTLLIAAGAISAAASAEPPPSLAQAQPGLWEISGAPVTGAPVRQCVAYISALARFEHRGKKCPANVLSSTAGTTAIEYRCGSAGFGHSDIQVITPRSLRIGTQGISDGLPFNYVLQAHRVDDCQKSASSARH
jgi:hypothetical protein